MTIHKRFVAIITIFSVVMFSSGCADQVRSPVKSASTAETVNTSGARNVLKKFLGLLNEGKYAEAVKYYGGSYNTLESWNPYVDKDDHATLLRNGCELNGLACLKIRKISQPKQVSPTEVDFNVQFSNTDGALFTRGPFPGDPEGTRAQYQFSYKVKKVGKRFLVQELPPYVP